MLPILVEEAEGPGPHTISLQDVQAPVPVKGIICLVQVQEDRMEYRLPQTKTRTLVCSVLRCEVYLVQLLSTSFNSSLVSEMLYPIGIFQ